MEIWIDIISRMWPLFFVRVACLEDGKKAPQSSENCTLMGCTSVSYSLIKGPTATMVRGVSAVKRNSEEVLMWDSIQPPIPAAKMENRWWVPQ